jgi:hypothetical protein
MVRRLRAGGRWIRTTGPAARRDWPFRDHLDRPLAPSPPREATYLARGTWSLHPVCSSGDSVRNRCCRRIQSPLSAGSRGRNRDRRCLDHRATLNRANLKCAILRDADLAFARLFLADLTAADLSMANITGRSTCRTLARSPHRSPRLACKLEIRLSLLTSPPLPQSSGSGVSYARAPA